MKPQPTDVIKINKNVQIHFCNGGVNIYKDGKYIRQPFEALKIFSVFAQFKSVKNGFAEFGKISMDMQECAVLFKIFYKLAQEKVFEVKGIHKPTFGTHPGNFDSFPVHIRMLNDRTRTTAFQQAIRETVTPNDIVLDIGTGSGILAVTAAMCGAKHVYAIETTEFIEVARAIFKANGLEDRITLLQGHSTEIELPEKASVLVSEIIGNDPFKEGILNTFEDAKNRLLTPDAKIIPAGIKLYAIALEAPIEIINKSQVARENIEHWAEWYGVDFSEFQNFVDHKEIQIISINSNLIRTKQWKNLSEAIELLNIDFHECTFVKESRHNILFKTDGELNSFILCFDAQLNKNVTISTVPHKVKTDCSWASKLHVLRNPLSVKENREITLRYHLQQLTSNLEIVGPDLEV